MPQPKLATFPAIRTALRFYQICSIITGSMLLLLVVEMIVKYGMGYELFAGGSGGALWFQTVVEGQLQLTGGGLNLSTGILVAHGWFYVVYLFSCFRVWSLMRWPFPRFLLLALGGVIPLLSFFLEGYVARRVRAYLAEREAQHGAPPLGDGSTLTQTIDRP